MGLRNSQCVHMVSSKCMQRESTIPFWHWTRSSDNLDSLIKGTTLKCLLYNLWCNLFYLRHVERSFVAKLAKLVEFVFIITIYGFLYIIRRLVITIVRYVHPNQIFSIFQALQQNPKSSQIFKSKEQPIGIQVFCASKIFYGWNRM